LTRNLFAALLAFAVSCLYYSTAQAETDFITREELALSAAITNKLSGTMTAKFRHNEDTEHFYTSTDIEVNYMLSKQLSVGAAYRKIYTLSSDVWVTEDRMHIQGAASWPYSGWKLKNRGRLEYRMRNGSDNRYRFRNKISFKSPWTIIQFGAKPYFAEEFFIDEYDGFNANRLYAGAVMRLSDTLSFDIYYIFEIGKTDDVWGRQIHALGTKLALKY
jgi:hypothetical protein